MSEQFFVAQRCFHKAAYKTLAYCIEKLFLCAHFCSVNVCLALLKSFTVSQCLALALCWSALVNTALLLGALS